MSVRIGKVKMKSGGEIYLLPDPVKTGRWTCDLPMGRITLENYEHDHITFERAPYLLKCAEDTLWLSA